MRTWSQVLTRFRDHLTDSGLSRSTVVGYVHDAKHFAAWLPSESENETEIRFTSGDMEAYKQHLVEERGRSPVSVNRCLQSLRRLGSFMVAQGLLETNPTREISRLSCPTRSTPRVLSPGEVDQLLQASTDSRARYAVRDHAILHLLLEAGVRVGELTHLLVGDIDLKGEFEYVTIRGNRERRVPLGPATVQALQAYLRPQRPPEAYLFEGRQGMPLSVRSVQEIIARLGRVANLDVSPKALRNTYTMRLWQQSGSLRLVAESLGYRRPEAVAKYVADLVPNHLTWPLQGTE